MNVFCVIVRSFIDRSGFSIMPSTVCHSHMTRAAEPHSFTAFLVAVTMCYIAYYLTNVYQLRSRPHDCTLTANDDTRNIIYRLRYCDIYLFVTILSFLSHCLRCVMSLNEYVMLCYTIDALRRVPHQNFTWWGSWVKLQRVSRQFLSLHFHIYRYISSLMTWYCGLAQSCIRYSDVTRAFCPWTRGSFGCQHPHRIYVFTQIFGQ